MDAIRIPVTEALEEVVEAVAANGRVVLVRDGKPVAEVTRPVTENEIPDLLSPEGLAGAADRRARLGIVGDTDGIVRAMRDEGY